VDAEVYEEDGKVWIRKTCPEHGEYKDLYWGSYRQYMRALEYDHMAKKLENPRTETVKGSQEPHRARHNRRDEQV